MGAGFIHHLVAARVHNIFVAILCLSNPQLGGIIDTLTTFRLERVGSERPSTYSANPWYKCKRVVLAARLSVVLGQLPIFLMVDYSLQRFTHGS